MGLRINTNLSALTARRNLDTATNQISDSFRKLSSGLRIQRASDDATGLAVSERLRAQIRSLEQARRNAGEGISLAQTAEGALDEISSVLLRLRELSSQAQNGTVSSADKQVLDDEFQSLVSEVDRIAATSEYGGISLLNASSTVALQVGSNAATVDSVTITLQSTTASALTLDSLDLTITGTGGPGDAIAAIDAAIDEVTEYRGSLGAISSRLTYTIDNLANSVDNLSAAESRIRDVDVAEETARLTQAQVLQQTALAILAQANVQPQVALSLLQ
ncbi:MAG: flagellin [Planctomycetota bacterium]